MLIYKCVENILIRIDQIYELSEEILQSNQSKKKKKNC